MIFTADEIQRIRSRTLKQVRLPVRRHPAFGFEVPCRYRIGGVYSIRRAPDWTAATLRDHQHASERDQPNRSRAVVAYLTGPIESPRIGQARPTGRHLTVMNISQQQTPNGKVWVIGFEYGDQRHKFDRDLYMKATPGVGGLTAEEHQDYTTQPALAMRGELPVMDPELQRRLSGAASDRDDQQRREHAHRARMSRRAA